MTGIQSGRFNMIDQNYKKNDFFVIRSRIQIQRPPKKSSFL